MRSTILSANLGSIWTLLEDHGYNPERLFQEVGIDPEALKNAEGRIDLSRAIELWQKVDQLFNDPCWGLENGKYWHPSQLQALGYAWISSKTLREALNRVVRYSKILTEGLVYNLSEGPDDVTIQVDFTFKHPASLNQPFAESSIAKIVTMGRINYGKKLKPLAVTFKHTEPKCSGEYFAFFKTNVRFGANKNSVSFSNEDIDKALMGYNPQLAKYADQAANQYLAKLDDADLTHRVKIKIIEMMPSGEVTTKNIVKQLYLSERSFSRKLNEAGTSFRELLDETRREMVSEYQKDKNVDLREMPYLLGYQSYSSFFRAYKRWTGEAPSGLAR
jgi:AraC-like DNA-binding protein